MLYNEEKGVMVMAKLIDSDFIRTHSIDEIFASIMSEYNEELEYCKKKDEEREQEIARFKEKYPFLFYPALLPFLV